MPTTREIFAEFMKRLSSESRNKKATKAKKPKGVINMNTRKQLEIDETGVRKEDQ